jgi:hypothetical protein
MLGLSLKDWLEFLVKEARYSFESDIGHGC